MLYFYKKIKNILTIKNKFILLTIKQMFNTINERMCEYEKK